MQHFDLLVIGAGSGGVRASRIAASLGAKVAVAEERYLGGTCVNVGCVPKKLFVYASHFSDLFSQSRGYGWSLTDPQLSWQRLRENKDREIARLNGVYGNLLDKAGVTLLEGHARLLGPGRVMIADQEVSAERIIIAVGGWPFVPEFPGREHVIDSNEVFYLDDLPEEIAIVGGGYIAAEFAGIFNGLGVKTHLIYRRELFLRGFDREIREFMAEQMQAKGIELHFNTDVDSITVTDTGARHVALNNGKSLTVGQVMYATGRRPLLDNLGLENTSVSLTDKGTIAVDDGFETAEPGIYAIGDVVGRAELTPVALAEGMALARNLFGEAGQPVNYDLIPTAVFTQPNIATVGLSEELAREKYTDIAVYQSSFKPMQLSLTDSPERCLLKVIVDVASDKVVGCHMAGPDAGEIIQGLAVAMTAGATKSDFDRTIGIHPTLAEEFVTLREPR
ncbi:glutathione-disulfide reductase [uncultured Gilvimarinus sp.]|uniref:glutathione-disulfide reductase n=1 Tax=uncultured Gilvimarinus sp. TaxID=1689143 RepID=UPI0030EF4662|tara:strand:- start:1935 stop:3281 length:1347 start_codon:yes stop_codon:yes gene_type:complete